MKKRKKTRTSSLVVYDTDIWYHRDLHLTIGIGTNHRRSTDTKLFVDGLNHNYPSELDIAAVALMDRQVGLLCKGNLFASNQ